MTWLIVCLGNPGEKYKHTRHNIGFEVADALVDDLGLEKVGKKFRSVLYKGLLSDVSLFLIKPQTFMNLSGEAVQFISSFYKIPVENILVIYDDVDIPFNTLRYRTKGSAGTHNGMKSIVNLLGSQDFPRLRLGVGPVPEDCYDLSDFVLGSFSSEELSVMPSFLSDVLPKVRDILYTDAHV